MRYLVDSDWTIDALHAIASALQPLEALTKDGLAVSIITCGEVYDGAFGSLHPEEHIANFRVFFAGFTVLGLSDQIMERFAQIRHTLRRQGNIVADWTSS